MREMRSSLLIPVDLDLLTQASGQIAIAVENALAYHEISELKDKLAQEKLYLEEEIRSEMNFENIIGNSPTLKHVLELVETVASSDSTVLVLGETGTGKELLARAIHDRSRRTQRTLVKLIVPQSRLGFWKANYLVTKRVRSQGR
jgi:formate hydrogenlyase transcriptional activator